MTITQRFREQVAPLLQASPVEAYVQEALENQAAVLILSTIDYGPLALEVRVVQMQDLSIEVFLDFPNNCRLLILTNWPKAKYDASGRIKDTILTSYKNGQLISMEHTHHSEAPDVIKKLLNRLGL